MPSENESHDEPMFFEAPAVPAEDSYQGQKRLQLILWSTLLLIGLLALVWYLFPARGDGLVEVEGQVIYAGAPLDDALIHFHAWNSEVPAEVKNGRYWVRLTPGPKTVRFSAFRKKGDEVIQLIPPPLPQTIERRDHDALLINVKGPKATHDFDIIVTGPDDPTIPAIP